MCSELQFANSRSVQFTSDWTLRDSWTKLAPIGNTETGWLLSRNQWRHCRANIVLFTHVQHHSRAWNVFVLVEMRVFLNFTILGEGSPSQTPHSLLFEIKFLFKSLKFYSANQCVGLPRMHKSKRWSEWASFEKISLRIAEYKAPLISVGRTTNFRQPSQHFH